MEYSIYTIVAAVAVAVLVALPIMGWFSRKNHFQVDGRTVVITGGSQGMGLGLAKLLAKKGANIVIVARDVKKLQAALETITTAAVRDSQRFHYISADVTKHEENERIVREVTAWNNGRVPDVVWANAGTSTPTLFLETSIETMRSQMEINYWAANYLAHSTLRAWVRPDTESSKDASQQADLPRHFVITASSAAFVGVAGYNPYGPGKAALRNLADGLRMELNLYNGARTRTSPPSHPEIKIHCIFPGSIRTPGYENENKVKHPVTKILEEGDPEQSEDEVALVAVKGLEKGNFHVATNYLAELMRISAMQGAPRNGWGLADTVISWVTSIAWLFIGPDMEGKVFKWGKANGMDGKES